MITHKDIQRLRKGNTKAFRSLYDVYFGKVYHYCLRFTRQAEDAEELAQNVFIQLWEQRQSIDLNKSFDAYLFTIAHHNACNFLKQKARKIAREQPLSDRSILTSSTEYTILFNELSQTLRDTMATLPEKRQVIFRMWYEEHYSDEEIADLLQLSVHTIKSQLAKASRTIRAAIDASTLVQISLTLLLLS